MLNDYDDLMEALRSVRRRVRRSRQPGGGNVAGPAWKPANPPRRNLGPPVVKALSALVMLVLAGFAIRLGIERADDDPPNPRPPAPPTHVAYTQRPVKIHSAPSGDSAVTRTLAAGERVLVSDHDSRHWVQVFETDGDEIGYAYESNGNLAPDPPAINQFGVIRSLPIGPDTQRRRLSRAPAPADTTAVCRDGWVSQSRHASGTCSGHGGVSRWVNHP